MSSSADTVETVDQTRSLSFHFPGNKLIDDERLQGLAAKAIWLVIPLEYYVLTRFDGGIDQNSFIPAAAMALICVLAMIATSAFVALIYPSTAYYVARVRGWTIALLSIWSAALSLIALSYFVTSYFNNVHEDVVGTFICYHWGCSNYPSISWQTLVAYFLYAIVAACIATSSIRMTPLAHQPDGQIMHDKIEEPNIFVAAILVSVIMMILHRASTV